MNRASNSVSFLQLGPPSDFLHPQIQPHNSGKHRRRGFLAPVPVDLPLQAELRLNNTNNSGGSVDGLDLSGSIDRRLVFSASCETQRTPRPSVKSECVPSRMTSFS